MIQITVNLKESWGGFTIDREQEDLEDTAVEVREGHKSRTCLEEHKQAVLQVRVPMGSLSYRQGSNG